MSGFVFDPPGSMSNLDPLTAEWVNDYTQALAAMKADGATHEHIATDDGGALYEVGTYLGDGTVSNEIPITGFDPQVVLLFGEGQAFAWKHPDMGTNEYYVYTGGRFDTPDSGMIIGTNKFTVKSLGGADYVNVDGRRYYYIAFRCPSTGAEDFSITAPATKAQDDALTASLSGTVDTAVSALQTAYQGHVHAGGNDGAKFIFRGSYTGDETAGVDVTTPAFKPSFVLIHSQISGPSLGMARWIKGESKARAIWRFIGGDSHYEGVQTEATLAADADGFNVGAVAAPDEINEDLTTFMYLCLFGDGTAADFGQTIPASVTGGKDYPTADRWNSKRTALLDLEADGKAHYHSDSGSDGGPLWSIGTVQTEQVVGWSYTAGFQPRWIFVFPRADDSSQKVGVACDVGGYSRAQYIHGGAAIPEVTFTPTGVQVGPEADEAWNHYSGGSPVTLDIVCIR